MTLSSEMATTYWLKGLELLVTESWFSPLSHRGEIEMSTSLFRGLNAYNPQVPSTLCIQ